MGENVIIFGADMSSFVHIDKKNKNTSILGEGPTQGLDVITLTSEPKYPINFTQLRKGFVLSLHFNGNKQLLTCSCYKKMSVQRNRLRNKRLHTMFR